MKKTILFALTNMNIGGTEKSLLNLLDTVSPDEFDVTILMLEKKGGFLNFIPDWVHIRVMENYSELRTLIMDPPLQIAKDCMKKRQIKKAVMIGATHLYYKMSNNRCPYYRYVLRYTPDIQEKYDIAVAYAGPFDFLTVYILEKVRADFKIQWIHFDVAKFFVNPAVMRECYPKFDRIYAVSDEGRDHLEKLIPEIKGKTFTKHNVVSSELCRRQAEEGETYSDNYQGIRILTVGRLSEEKGQDIIPEIAAGLRRKNIDFMWYLVGDGKLLEKIKQNSAKYQVEDKLVYLGTTANPYAFYRDADLYVQTSVHEGFCITLAEALAFDLPVVTTDFAGAREQLENKTKYSITRRDPAEMCEAITAVLNM